MPGHSRSVRTPRQRERGVRSKPAVNAKKPVRPPKRTGSVIVPAATLRVSQREPRADKRGRAGRILAKLRREYPGADCALRHNSAYELVVATILSAQCTDERVNKVTPAFFARFPTVESLAAAPQSEVEALIHTCGFFRNKARNLVGMAQRVVAEFDGQIPDTMEGLLTLPGVARKTANCVLGTWFKKPDGVVVDTHVGRLAHRLGLTTTARNTKDAEKIERDLMDLIPQDAWTYFSHALILHGRTVCTARKPKCPQCILQEQCPSVGAFG